MNTQEEQFIHIDKYGDTRYYADKAMEIFHRIDGPAIEYADGTKSWYVNGKLHRLDGPATESQDGAKSWYVNGKLHRLEGPAVEYAEGYKAWYVDGKRHRLDGGPVIEYSDGSKRWFVNGKFLTEAAFIALTESKTVELTLDQIAKKFEINVNNLKIIK
jgi:hypothetical protein